jgi:hypothetical protein
MDNFGNFRPFWRQGKEHEARPRGESESAANQARATNVKIVRHAQAIASCIERFDDARRTSKSRKHMINRRKPSSGPFRDTLALVIFLSSCGAGIA